MEITGRLTKDATVGTTKEGKQVVIFSIAINDRYWSKGSKIRKVTTYIQCSYWQNIKVAEWLKKGIMVQLHGRIGIHVYKNIEGEAAGFITFHVNNIKVLAFPKSKGTDEQTNSDSKPQQDNSEDAGNPPF